MEIPCMLHSQIVVIGRFIGKTRLKVGHRMGGQRDVQVLVI